MAIFVCLRDSSFVYRYAKISCQYGDAFISLFIFTLKDYLMVELINDYSSKESMLHTDDAICARLMRKHGRRVISYIKGGRAVGWHSRSNRSDARLLKRRLEADLAKI